MADHQTINKARKNGMVRIRPGGERATVDEVVDLLVAAAEQNQNQSVKRNANRLLKDFADRGWDVTRGRHNYGIGGRMGPPDKTWHITLQTRRGGYHLRLDNNKYTFQITGPGMEPNQPSSGSGTGPGVMGRQGVAQALKRVRLRKKSGGFVDLGGEASSGGFGKLGGRLREGLKSTVRHLGPSILLDIIMAALRWLRDKAKLDALKPKIEQQMRQQMLVARDLTAEGKQAYANVELTQTTRYMESDNDPLDRSALGKWVEVGSEFSAAVRISGDKIEKEPTQHIGYESGERPVYTTYTYSVPLGIPQEEIDYYRGYKEDLKMVDETLKDPYLGSDDRRDLVTAKAELERTFREAFENKLPGEVDIFIPFIDLDDADFWDWELKPFCPESMLPSGWKLPMPDLSVGTPLPPLPDLSVGTPPPPSEPSPPRPSPPLVPATSHRAPKQLWGTTNVRSELVCRQSDESLGLRCGETVSPGARRVYIVAPGDTLHAIAQKFYGDPRKFHKISAANKTIIGPKNTIHPGDVLVIPE
jgi:hypothetical protein